MFEEINIILLVGEIKISHHDTGLCLVCLTAIQSTTRHCSPAHIRNTTDKNSQVSFVLSVLTVRYTRWYFIYWVSYDAQQQAQTAVNVLYNLGEGRELHQTNVCPAGQFLWWYVQIRSQSSALKIVCRASSTSHNSLMNAGIQVQCAWQLWGSNPHFMPHTLGVTWAQVGRQPVCILACWVALRFQG